MGEQEHSSILATGLLYSGIMRNSRGKLFVYVALLGTFCIIMFIFKHTHSNLKELEGVNQKCQQQRDSLSAQLQVVYEHRNRIEKSLQQEKSEHTHTREECETQHQDMEKKLQQDKEKLQALEKQHNLLKNSYSQLDDEKNILERKMQDQLHALEKQKGDEILRLQTQLNDLLEEKDKLEKSNAAYKQKLEVHMGELNICQFQLEQMDSKLKSAREEMKKLQSHGTVGEFEKSKITEHNQQTVPKGESADIYEKVRSALSNVSAHKEKQVLMRPNIQPPDIRKSLPGSSVSKHTKDVPDANADHLSLNNHIDDPLKTHNAMEADPNRKNSETQNQANDKIETNDINPGEENSIKLFQQEPVNHPQVQPPHNFDDAGERGEVNMFQQNGMDEQRRQLEQPLNKENELEIKKRSNGGAFPQPNNGLAVPHLQGPLEKPGEDNDVHDNHVHPPFGIPHNDVKRESPSNRIADRNAGGEDDDEDQDGENEEEQLMGGGQAVRGRAFQDRDFDDDQDNGENENVAKEEEGIMVAPR